MEGKGNDSLDPIEILATLVVEALRIRQVRPCICVLGDPDAHVRIRPPHLPDMARQSLEIAVPMDRNEIRAAFARAGRKEVLQPREARLGARDRGRPEFHALRFQGLDVGHPRASRKVGAHVAAAGGGGAVGLVEREDVGDVRAGRELGLNSGKEGRVGGGGRGSKEHRDELESRRGTVEVGGRGGAVVVVPGQVGG